MARTYEVTITGSTPLLMHQDNIDWADQIGKWLLVPENKKMSKAGDDRTPAFNWIGGMYHDDEVICIPSDNIMRALMEGGAMVPVPGGKNGKTFKSQSQSGMSVVEPFWPVSVNGKQIPVARIFGDLANETDFDVHKKTVAELGFRLFIKRAKVGTSKHVRVRPRFDTWSVSGHVSVWDEQITDQVIEDIFAYAGKYKGLCDWRPGGKTPGSFGMFSTSVRKVG